MAAPVAPFAVACSVLLSCSGAAPAPAPAPVRASARAVVPHETGPKTSPAAGRGTAQSDACSRVRVVGNPPGDFVVLPIEGYEDALVAVPAGALAPRPIVVATHGAGGSPEPHCRYWRGVVGRRAFVICPRGRALASVRSGLPNTGYYYPDHLVLGREVAACVDAVVQRFAGEIDPSAAVYVGFSQGATMGALMLGHEPGRFARAALVEGGFDVWSPASARAFHAGGGERVLLGCGRSLCTEGASTTARQLEREGIAARVVRDERSGHALDGPLAEEVSRAFEWLVEGDARFAR